MAFPPASAPARHSCSLESLVEAAGLAADLPSAVAAQFETPAVLLETAPGRCRPAQSQFRTISRQNCARGKKTPRYPYDNRARPNCQVPDRLVLWGTVAVRNPLHAFNLIGPPEKAHQIPPFSPKKSEDVSRLKAFGLLAGIRLDAPLKIFAAPGPQAVATGRIPDKAKRSKHH